MKRTVKVKINMPKSKVDFLAVCNQIFNKYVNWAYENRTYSKAKAHLDLYKKLREEYSTIPSALIQSIRDSALEAVKAIKFNPRKNRPSKRNFSAVRYDKRTLSFKNSLVSISTNKKRHREKVSHPRIDHLLNSGWKFSAGSLQFDPQKKSFFLNLIFSKIDPPKVKGSIVGLDRGIYNLVTLSTGEKISSKSLRRIKRIRSFNRKQLQAKGTPSAKRKLRNLSGKERRLSRDINHCITKDLASREDVAIFVLENLKGIRNRRRGKVLNLWLSNWPFYQFEQFLTYKAQALGKQVVYTDPRFTSQKCSRCGHRDSRNRKKAKFRCSRCNYQGHADINAAINIRDQWINSNLGIRAGCCQSAKRKKFQSSTTVATSPLACLGGS